MNWLDVQCLNVSWLNMQCLNVSWLDMQCLNVEKTLVKWFLYFPVSVFSDGHMTSSWSVCNSTNLENLLKVYKKYTFIESKKKKVCFVILI